MKKNCVGQRNSIKFVDIFSISCHCFPFDDVNALAWETSSSFRFPCSYMWYNHFSLSEENVLLKKKLLICLNWTHISIMLLFVQDVTFLEIDTEGLKWLLLCSMMSFSAFITCFSKFDISVCFLSTLSTLSVFLNLNKSYKNRSTVEIKLPEVLLNNLHRGVLTEKQLSSDDVNSVSDCGTIAYVPNRLIVVDKLHPAHALIFVTPFSHIPPPTYRKMAPFSWQNRRCVVSSRGW